VIIKEKIERSIVPESAFQVKESSAVRRLANRRCPVEGEPLA
jgi:hypothetical protein